MVGKSVVAIQRELPVVDARGKARFEGSEPDPRPGVAPGHIPGSRNLPYASLYRDDGTFKSNSALAAEFEVAGVDPAKPFIATCGSGVTANSLIFAARRLGGRGHKLYDGSWSDYGADPATPKEIGSSALEREQLSQSLELVLDRCGQSVDRRAICFEASIPQRRQHFQSRDRSGDGMCRHGIEQRLLRFARVRPGGSEIVISASNSRTPPSASATASA